MSTLAEELFILYGCPQKVVLAPVLLVLILFGGLLILAQGSSVPPFIYTVY